MKRPTISICLAGLALAATNPTSTAQEAGAAAHEAGAAAPAASLTDEVKADTSFGLGYQMGRQLGGSGLGPDDLSQEKFQEGFTVGMTGGDLDPGQEQKISAAMQQLQQVLRARMEAAAEENLKKATAFLDENAKKEGVKTTESGLQYKILKKGDGPTYEGDGSDNPRFQVKYEGRFIDGKKFDGDIEGEPVSFGLQVVPGFREALQMMPKGSRWRLFLSPDLAYGKRGSGGRIPPNSALVFDLEVVDFKSGAAVSPPVQITPPPEKGE